VTSGSTIYVTVAFACYFNLWTGLRTGSTPPGVGMAGPAVAAAGRPPPCRPSRSMSAVCFGRRGDPMEPGRPVGHLRNGPPRRSGFANAHLGDRASAIYDSVNSIDHALRCLSRPWRDARPTRRLVAAAPRRASSLRPPSFRPQRRLFQATLSGVAGKRPRLARPRPTGIAVGRFVATRDPDARPTDGAKRRGELLHRGSPRVDWRPTPVPPFAPAQTPQWPDVTPFALGSRLPVPPGPAPGR